MNRILTALLLTLGIPLMAQTTATSINGVPNQTITGQAVAQPQYIGPQAISGCGVEYVSGLTYTIGACLYSINGVTYSSPLSNITLTTADPTNPRIDVIYVDASQTVQAIAGTPAASPQQPTVDPSTQLALTFVLVPATATTPANTTLVDIYLEGVEWPPSKGGTSSANVNLVSTNNPYSGTKDVEFGTGGTVATTTFAGFTVPSAGTVQLQNYNNLVFYIRNKTAWPATRSITIQWFNGSTAKGQGIVINNGAYGYNATSNTTGYQQVSIPTSVFGIAGIPVTSVRFAVSGTGANLVGFYLDQITLQGGQGAGITLPTTLMNFKGTWNSTTAYLANDTVVSGGVGYVALAANTNVAVSTTATWAALGGGGGGSGTVTNVATDGTSGITGGPITTTGTVACLQSSTSQFGCVKPDGSTIVASGGVLSAVGGGGGGGSQIPSNAHFVFAGNSVNQDDTGVISPHVAVSAWSQTGGITTVTTSSAHGFTTGTWVDFGHLTGWTGPPAATRNGTGNIYFQVLSSGLTSTQFQVTAATTSSCASSCGYVENMAGYFPYAVTSMPGFPAGAANRTFIYYPLAATNIATLDTDYTATLHPSSPAVTGFPTYLVIEDFENDLYGILGSCNLLSPAIESHYSSLFTKATADGYVIVTGPQANRKQNYQNCPSIYFTITQVNSWFGSQAKTQTNGGNLNLYVDLGTPFDNSLDTTLIATNGAFTAPGAQLAAANVANVMVSGISNQLKLQPVLSDYGYVWVAAQNVRAPFAWADGNGVRYSYDDLIDYRKYIQNMVINVTRAGNPSGGQDGDIWYDTTAHQLKSQINGVIVNLGAGGGSGTVTVVGAGSLTSTALVTGGGTQTIQTPSATSTLDSSGNMSIAGTLTVAGASGNILMNEGTPSAGASGVDILSADATSHRVKENPNNAGAVILSGTSAARTAGNCAAYATNGIDLVDAGGPCGISGGGVTAFNGDGTFSSNSGSTGTVTFALANATAHKWWGNNTGSSAAPGYQTIGSQDESPSEYVAGGGTGNAQTATLSPAATSLATGLRVEWKPTAANTGAATLAVNGLTTKNITKCGTTALVANDLTTAAVAIAIYDGTQFQLINPQAATCGGGGGGGGLTPATPYLTDGSGNYYEPGTMFLVTRPSSTPTWINSVAPTSATAGANGNMLINNTANATWATLSGSSSVTGILAQQAIDANYNGSGVWLWDSTNNLIYLMNVQTNASPSSLQIYIQSFTYNGSGSPAFSTTITTTTNWVYFQGRYNYFKIIKSGANLLFQESPDGGTTWATIYTKSGGIGTISSGGYYSSSAAAAAYTNIMSIAVN